MVISNAEEREKNVEDIRFVVIIFRIYYGFYTFTSHSYFRLGACAAIIAYSTFLSISFVLIFFSIVILYALISLII